MCPARSGGSRHGCPVPRLPVAGALLQLPGKHRASRDACREPIMDLRLQAARLQHLPECCGAAALTAGSSSTCRDVARPAQLSSTGQMGLGAAGAAFPQQHSLQDIPKALGSQGWGERSNQHQLLLHHFSSFTEHPPSLGGYSVPQHDCPAFSPHVNFGLGNQNICETCSFLKT